MKTASKRCVTCAYFRKLYRFGGCGFFRNRGEKERYCILREAFVSSEDGCSLWEKKEKKVPLSSEVLVQGESDVKRLIELL